MVSQIRSNGSLCVVSMVGGMSSVGGQCLATELFQIKFRVRAVCLKFSSAISKVVPSQLNFEE